MAEVASTLEDKLVGHIHLSFWNLIAVWGESCHWAERGDKGTLRALDELFVERLNFTLIRFPRFSQWLNSTLKLISEEVPRL